MSLQPGGTTDWVEAPLNRPLTTGDALWSDADSRVELQLDGSLLRLDSFTAVSLLNVADHITQIQLTSGTLIVRVRRLDDDETYEIDTPNLALSLLRPGLYRISVNDAGDVTNIGVASGQGEVTGGGSAYPVNANEQVAFTGTDDLTADVASYGQAQSPFDAWSATRDDRWEHSVSARYVSADVVGFTDLDDQGSWDSTPDYGYVWFPRGMVPGWAPYQLGHWAYIAPWGYTWVDDQPWGYAPFHYGRWISERGAWGWVPAPPQSPGAVYVRPVYAPALVAWVGVGAGVAWFALGPREVYVPSYPVSRSYVTNINVSNTIVNRTVVDNIYNTTIVNKTVNVTNVTYVNRGISGAVTATTAQAFTSAQPVRAHAVAFDSRAGGPVQVFAPAAVPTRQAVLGAGRMGTAKPPAAVQIRTVVARTAPPPPLPTFERRQQAIQRNGGRSLSMAAVQQIQSQAPARAAPVRLAPPATLGSDRQRPIARPAVPTVQAPRPAVAAVHPNESPAPPRPASPAVANSALERQHLQEQQQLAARQDQERQQVQQQQEQEHQQLARQQAQDAQKQQLQQQLEQQHQQQTQALLQRHVQEQQQLQQRQQQERQEQESHTKPAVRKPDRTTPPDDSPPPKQ